MPQPHWLHLVSMAGGSDRYPRRGCATPAQRFAGAGRRGRSNQRGNHASTIRDTPVVPTSRRSPFVIIAVVIALLAIAGAGAFMVKRSRTKPTAAEKPAATLAPIPPAAAASIVRLRPEVVATYPHDPGSFTQGLLIDDRGRLFESAGNYGQSNVREVELITGKVLREASNESTHFAEGLALVRGELVQLTWKEKVALRWNPDTFALNGTFSYEGEGWGLCPDQDGARLVMSDGSNVLTFRDPVTFAKTGSVNVARGGVPLRQLNELECVDGKVYANVWQTNTIVAIDPSSGAVTEEIDATGLLPEGQRAGADVLNGIAHKSDRDTFLITGKHWPSMFEVRFVPAA